MFFRFYVVLVSTHMPQKHSFIFFSFWFLSIPFPISSLLPSFSFSPLLFRFLFFFKNKMFDFIGSLLGETKMFWIRQFSNDLDKCHTTLYIPEQRLKSTLSNREENYLSKMFSVFRVSQGWNSGILMLECVTSPVRHLQS